MTDFFLRAGRSANVDFSFRPEYWDTDGLLTAPWANIKGSLRRRHIRRVLEQGLEASLHPDELDESLPEEIRRAVARVHPALMGGEYLPDLLPGEVEIARIEFASATRDVTSIRALPVGRRIYYRVNDEHQVMTEIEYRTPFTWTSRPLTLRRLIHLIDHTVYPRDYTGLVTGFLDFVVVGCQTDLEEWLGFVDVSSEFYPDLGRYYSWRLERWERRVRRYLEGKGPRPTGFEPPE